VDVDSKHIYIHVYETSGCAYNLKVDVDDNWTGIMIKRTSNQWKLPNSLTKSSIDISLHKTKLCVITLFYYHIFCPISIPKNMVINSKGDNPDNIHNVLRRIVSPCFANFCIVNSLNNILLEMMHIYKIQYKT
jgi:hypothetical protein